MFECEQTVNHYTYLYAVRRSTYFAMYIHLAARTQNIVANVDRPIEQWSEGERERDMEYGVKLNRFI